jgi:glycosyltransferase involved in cell wall biosynthesis
MKVALFLGNAGHNSGGPEVYETELVRSIVRLKPDYEFHLMCLFPNAADVIGAKEPNVTYHILRPGPRIFSMSAVLPFKLSRLSPRVVHSTFMAPPVTMQPHVLTLVCLSMFDAPEFYPALVRRRLQALTLVGLKTADRILCVSEDVRDRVSERFRISADRLAVTPMGVHPRFRCYPREAIRDYLDRQSIHCPYFLFSGRWEKRKNLLGILEAFALFKRETGLPHKLVLSGKRTWIEVQAEALIRSLGIQNDVVDHGKTALEHLPYLYAGADALVYASFYESFGMPIVEAMACGTPVITSNITAMPETAGGAAMLIDPYSPASIAEAMQQIATRQDVRAIHRAAGLRHAQKFTWEATAGKTLDAYQTVAANN